MDKPTSNPERYWEEQIRRGDGLIADGCYYQDTGWSDRPDPTAMVVTYRHLATGEAVTTNALTSQGKIPDAYRDRLADNIELLQSRSLEVRDAHHEPGYLDVDALRPAPTYPAEVVFEADPWVTSIGRAVPVADQFVALRSPWPENRICRWDRDGGTLTLTDWLVLSADDAYQYFGIDPALEPDIGTSDRITISDPTTTWVTEARAFEWSSYKAALLVQVEPPRPVGPGHGRDQAVRWQLSELSLPEASLQPLLPLAGMRVPHPDLEVYHVVPQHAGRQVVRSGPILGQLVRALQGPHRDVEVYYRYPTSPEVCYVGPNTLDYFGCAPDLTTALCAMGKIELGVRAGYRTVVTEDLGLSADQPRHSAAASRLIADPLRRPRPTLRARPDPAASRTPELPPSP